MGALFSILAPIFLEIARLMVELFFPIKKESTNETQSTIDTDVLANPERLRGITGKSSYRTSSSMGKDGDSSTDSGQSEDQSPREGLFGFMDHG